MKYHALRFFRIFSLKRYFVYLSKVSWWRVLLLYMLFVVVAFPLVVFVGDLVGVSGSESANIGINVTSGLDPFPQSIVSDDNVKWDVILLVLFISIVVLAAKMFFESMVVVKMMRPPVDIRSSDFFVLDKHWNKDDHDNGFLTLRLLNATPMTLVNVSIKAVLVVSVKRENSKEFRLYFPVEGNGSDIDPQEITIFTPHTLWTYAINYSLVLTNSVESEHRLDSINCDDVMECSRSIDLIIDGKESEDGAEFLIHKTIPLDFSNGKNYSKKYKEGTFIDCNPVLKEEEYGCIQNYTA